MTAAVRSNTADCFFLLVIWRSSGACLVLVAACKRCTHTFLGAVCAPASSSCAPPVLQKQGHIRYSPPLADKDSFPDSAPWDIPGVVVAHASGGATPAFPSGLESYKGSSSWPVLCQGSLPAGLVAPCFVRLLGLLAGCLGVGCCHPECPWCGPPRAHTARCTDGIRQ
jgi:hypothetical protein